MSLDEAATDATVPRSPLVGVGRDEVPSLRFGAAADGSPIDAERFVDVGLSSPTYAPS